MVKQKHLSLQFTNEEALVLFEFLARFNEKEHTNIFEDQSEQKVLWILQGQLEEQLVEMFDPDYRNIINQARNNVRDK